MTLDNLAKIGRLKPHAASMDEIADLVNAALRNLDDAHAENISPENRFDAAYKCIMQAALVGLLANGFRAGHQGAGPSIRRSFKRCRRPLVSMQDVWLFSTHCETSEISLTTQVARSTWRRSTHASRKRAEADRSRCLAGCQPSGAVSRHTRLTP